MTVSRLSYKRRLVKQKMCAAFSRNSWKSAGTESTSWFKRPAVLQAAAASNRLLAIIESRVNQTLMTEQPDGQEEMRF